MRSAHLDWQPHWAGSSGGVPLSLREVALFDGYLIGGRSIGPASSPINKNRRDDFAYHPGAPAGPKQTGGFEPQTGELPAQTGGLPDATGGAPIPSEGAVLLVALPPDVRSAVEALGGRPNQAAMRAVLLRLLKLRWWTPSELAAVLGRSKVAHLSGTYLSPMVREGQLKRRYPDSPAHPKQAYRLTLSVVPKGRPRG